MGAHRWVGPLGAAVLLRNVKSADRFQLVVSQGLVFRVNRHSTICIEIYIATIRRPSSFDAVLEHIVSFEAQDFVYFKAHVLLI